MKSRSKNKEVKRKRKAKVHSLITLHLPARSISEITLLSFSLALFLSRDEDALSNWRIQLQRTQTATGRGYKGLRWPCGWETNTGPVILRGGEEGRQGEGQRVRRGACGTLITFSSIFYNSQLYLKSETERERVRLKLQAHKHRRKKGQDSAIGA